MAMLNNQMVTIVYYSYSYIDGVTNQNRHRAGGGPHCSVPVRIGTTHDPFCDSLTPNWINRPGHIMIYHDIPSQTVIPNHHPKV